MKNLTYWDEDLESANAPEYEGGHQPVGNSVDPNIFTQKKMGTNGYAIVPLWVLKEIARTRAYHAGPLIGVLLQRMRVRKVDTMPITCGIWAEIGSPNERERWTILQQLRRIPDVLRLEERREGFTHYQVVLSETWIRE
jgi:hypothetical protein